MILSLLAAAALLTVQPEPSTISSSIQRGAQRVPFLTLRLSASCASPIAVSSITLTHQGAGRGSDILRIYAMDGMQRVSRAAAPAERDGRVTVRMRGFSIQPCTKRTITLSGDVSPEALGGGEHRYILRSPDDIAIAPSDAQVMVETARPSQSVLRPVGPARGSATVTMLPLLLPATYGDERTVARMRLESSGDDELLLTAITLTNDGKARDGDLIRLTLLGGNGKPLGPMLDGLDGDRAHFVLDPPLRLSNNDSRMLTVRASVRASRRQTINFVLEEPSDVETESLGRGR